MRRLLTIGFLMLAVVSQAQVIRGLKGGYNTENYPEITFIWNTASLDPLQKSDFVLTEDDVKMDFDFAMLENNNPKPYKKNVLFLWEDMKSHSYQTDNIRALLEQFFSTTEFGPNDRFRVAVFNRKSDTIPSFLNFLTDFEQNRYSLIAAVDSYQKSERKYDRYPDQSDLYLAINDGVNLLKKEPEDRVGIIVVLTAGLNMKASGASTEMESVRKNAEEAGIPVYVVKYVGPFGKAPEVDNLAKYTNGLTIELENNEVDRAVAELQDLYRKLDTRCYGKDYRFTFVTSAKRDGKPHPFLFTVNKAPQSLQPFVAPEMTFWLWVQQHLYLCIGLLVLLIGLIVMTILLLVHSNKKRKRREAASDAKLQRKLDEVDQERAIWEQQQAAKEAMQQASERRKASEEEAARLVQLMETKNLYPRLQCAVSGGLFSYMIKKPVTRIGRATDNDVVLNNQTVSKYHAEIRFTGYAFEVINRSTSYTQGIIVNGQFFQRTTLKSGDIIGLGEAVVTFYI